MREASDVGRLRIDRRVIDLEVAGVNDDAVRRSDREADGVDDRMRDANRLDAKRSGIDDVARHEPAKLDVVDAEFIELVADEAEGQRHSVDRKRHALEKKRQRADVIFVAMREEDRFEFRGVVEDVRHVGNNDVDAERGGVGEHHSAVDDDRGVVGLVDHQVHPDLAESAERNDAQAAHRGAVYRAYTLRMPDKLKLSGRKQPAVINAPADYDISDDAATTLNGKFDWIQLFLKNEAE